MGINPLKALQDSIEKLIIEHGSAVIHEKHIILLKDQLSFADREITKLITENSKFQSNELNFLAEINQLRAKISSLENDNTNLKKKIQEYKQSTHDIPPDDLKIKILLFLSEQNELLPAESIANYVRSNPQVVLHHLTELKKDTMVLISRMINSSPLWGLDNKGRKYLVTNNLIS